MSYIPIFNKKGDLIAWSTNKYVWDLDLNWVAYINSNNVWHVNGDWIGKFYDFCFTDIYGKVFGWNPDYKVEQRSKSQIPLRSLLPKEPEKPEISKQFVKIKSPNLSNDIWSYKESF